MTFDDVSSSGAAHGALAALRGVPADVVARLLPWVEAGALSAASCLLAAAAARRCAEHDADVLLAMALAAEAVNDGHTGVLVRSVEAPARVVDGEATAASVAPVLPADREVWLAKIAASPAIRDEGAGGRSSAPYVLRNGLLMIARMADAERAIADGIHALLSSTPTDAPSSPEAKAWLGRFLLALFGAEPGSGEVPRQTLAAARGVSASLTVVTGGPGMGKTWSIRGLLIGLLLAGRWSGKRRPPAVALAATTGKAAARMREAIQEDLNGLRERYLAALIAAGEAPHIELPGFDELLDFLGGLPEFTMHRLLGYQPRQRTRFRHNRANPLPWDVVVLDEASMADVSVMAALLDAVDPRTTRLVIVGDRNQLASVESGTVLSDVCGPAGDPGRALDPALAMLAGEWGLTDGPVKQAPPSAPLAAAVVPFVRFHRFRDESGIGLLARTVVDSTGDDWPVDTVVAALRAGRDDFAWIDAGTPDQLRDRAMDDAVDRYLPYVQAAAGLQLALIGAQRLAPDAEAAFSALFAQFDTFRILAPNRVGRDGVERLNDRIAARLVEELKQRGVSLKGRSRFWVGQPLLVTRNDYELGLYNGDIGIVLRVKSDEGTALRAVFRVMRGQETTWRVLAPERLPAATTALAMTIHKCQGSQFDRIALLLPRESSALLTRELVYTGVTRARRAVTLFGSEGVLRSALCARVRRDASLRSRLWGNS